MALAYIMVVVITLTATVEPTSAALGPHIVVDTM